MAVGPKPSPSMDLNSNPYDLQSMPTPSPSSSKDEEKKETTEDDTFQLMDEEEEEKQISQMEKLIQLLQENGPEETNSLQTKAPDSQSDPMSAMDDEKGYDKMANEMNGEGMANVAEEGAELAAENPEVVAAML